MKRTLIFVAVAVALAVGFTALLVAPGARTARVAAVNTCKLLQERGFKTRLTDFNFSVSPEMRQRAAALTNAEFGGVVSPELWGRRNLLLHSKDTDLMRFLNTNSASVVWMRETIITESGDEMWAGLRQVFEEQSGVLDLASQAILAGPIGFELASSAGASVLLPHLARQKNLAQLFSLRAMLELHDGNTSAAWMNLLACSRLSTAWAPEAVEISHLVRFACASIAFEALWQALQTNAWTDAQLAQMQEQWQGANFFGGLPETVAFTRACMVNACQNERQPQIGWPFSGLPLVQTLKRPGQALGALKDYRRRLRYRVVGSYEDEKASLLYFRDRETEMRDAVVSATWEQMRRLPGVTNAPQLSSKYRSSFMSTYNVRQISLNLSRREGGLLGKAAEAEARRRIAITALALERYRLRFGQYPRTLADLDDEKAADALTDFMDGQPLRYRVTDEGFVLYSVGLDCVDGGGSDFSSQARQVLNEPQRIAPDIVWPRRPGPAELAKALQAERREARHRQANSEADRDMQNADVLAQLEKLHLTDQGGGVLDPGINGEPLSSLLQSPGHGTLPLPIEQLLSLKQVPSNDKPAIATFDVPANYDALRKIGELRLLVDAYPDDPGDFRGGWVQECTRAANGTCLLSWDTIYDRPGKHFVRAALKVKDENGDSVFIMGPLVPFYSSNIFQFSQGGSFDERSAFLSAKMSAPVGACKIEIKSPHGEHLKTFERTTTNGLVEVYWDLIDDHGRRYANESFEAVFSATFPDDEQTQTNSGTKTFRKRKRNLRRN